MPQPWVSPVAICSAREKSQRSLARPRPPPTTIAHLKDNLATRRNDHGGRPQLDDEGVELVRLEVGDILRLVVAMREVRAVTRGGGVDGTEGGAKEAFAERHGVASGAGVEDLLAFGVDVAQRNEEVDVLGVRSILPLLNADDEASEWMSCDFGLLVGSVGKL